MTKKFSCQSSESAPKETMSRLPDVDLGMNKFESGLLRKPFRDVTNGSSSASVLKRKSVSFSDAQPFDKDVIPLEKENLYVPDSISPAPRKVLLSFFSQEVIYLVMFL